MYEYLTVEMHGGLPLDVETVISEAVGLRMAEACDGLVLTGLQYFYAGATAFYAWLNSPPKIVHRSTQLRFSQFQKNQLVTN